MNRRKEELVNAFTMVGSSFGRAEFFDDDKIAALFCVLVCVKMSGYIVNEIVGEYKIDDVRSAFFTSRDELDTNFFSKDTYPFIEYGVHFTIHSTISKSTA